MKTKTEDGFLADLTNEIEHQIPDTPEYTPPPSVFSEPTYEPKDAREPFCMSEKEMWDRKTRIRKLAKKSRKKNRQARQARSRNRK